MKEYVVIEIQCKKELTFFDVYSLLKSNVSYQGNLFAFQNIRLDKLRAQARETYDRLLLDKFAYRIVLDHLVNTSYYNPELHDLRMVSNLDSCWKWCNEQINESLPDNDFKDLLTFSDSLKAQDVMTVVAGFDQIEWDGSPVGKGTYGFEKADGFYGLGKNYLSNSVVVGRTHENRPYTAFLSCEKRFRNLEVIDQIVESLGKKKYEEIYFAPENESERAEWILKVGAAKRRFDDAIAGLQSLPLEKIEHSFTIDSPRNKINTKNYIKKYLCTDGWCTRPARSDECPTVIYKAKNDNEIAFSIVSGNMVQNLQVLIYYRSREFLLSENLHDLHVLSVNEQNIDAFFRNVVQVRDYFYDGL